MGAPCYHMSEVLGRRDHINLWQDVVAGRPDWDRIFDGYGATVDFPASFYFKELASFYPNAKVILSLRDAERWFLSTQTTIFSETMQNLHAGSKWSAMLDGTIHNHFGCALNDRAGLIKAFEDHISNVTAAFGEDRLLVFRSQDGWEPLCEFLGVPVPADEYPNVNSKEEFGAIFELLSSPFGARIMDGEGLAEGNLHQELFGDG